MAAYNFEHTVVDLGTCKNSQLPFFFKFDNVFGTGYKHNYLTILLLRHNLCLTFFNGLNYYISLKFCHIPQHTRQDAMAAG